MLVQTGAIDPASAVSAVQGFVLDGSPGLRAAAMANTAVFTSGFGVLRLGLTLAVSRTRGFSERCVNRQKHAWRCAFRFFVASATLERPWEVMTDDRYFRARATRTDNRRCSDGRSVSEYQNISFQSDPGGF